MNSYDVGGVRLARPFKIRRLGHTGLNVSSFDKTVDFYTRILGFHVADNFDVKSVPGFNDGSWEIEDGRSAFLSYGSDHHALVLVHKSLEFLLGTGVPGTTVNQITWQVNSLSEVVDGGKFLAEHGAETVRSGRDLPGSNWAVYFKAPDGHINEFYYGMEQIGWNRKSKPRAMYHLAHNGPITVPQQSERNEIAEAAQKGIDIDAGYQSPAANSAPFEVGGVHLERPFKIVRIGPLRFFVPNVDEMVTFYRDVMGLVVTEEVYFEGMRCVFLRAGSEHHSLALYPLELREMLGFSSHSQCMSLGFQVGSYRQLRDALQHLQREGCKIIDFPSELHSGIDYTVNLLDPEGHCVQLYYYMEQIGWDGKPRSEHLRPLANNSWPETIESQSDTFADSPFQGPLE